MAPKLYPKHCTYYHNLNVIRKGSKKLLTIKNSFFKHLVQVHHASWADTIMWMDRYIIFKNGGNMPERWWILEEEDMKKLAHELRFRFNFRCLISFRRWGRWQSINYLFLIYTWWPRNNGTGYFPRYVDAITSIRVWGSFSWEKWYQDQQFWFSSLFSRAHFGRQCRGPKFSLFSLN